MIIDYTAPDLSAIKNSIDAMEQHIANAKFSSEKINYLPDLVTKSSTWFMAAVKCRNVLVESNQKLTVSLNSTVDHLNKLGSAHDQIDNEKEQDELLTEIKSVINTSLDSISDEEQTLTGALKNLSGAFNDSATKGYLADFGAELERLNAITTTQDSEHTLLIERRKLLTDGIDQFELMGLADGAKDAILTAQKLSELGMTPPQVAIINLAVDQLGKQIENAKVTFNFLDLLANRDGLTQNIESLKVRIETNKQDISDVATRMDLLKAVHSADAERLIITKEFSHLTDTVSLFLKASEVSGQTDAERYKYFVEQATQLINHLTDY